ncbi:SDR family NAD(P)-dependent oxidoreductase [Nocardia fluminea]|uniref:SDR family NAD(P)-dependent oxidoreductase n=1 Tax=Nocardia fluminea TaxID=134984 RepID=UPI0033FEC0C7
MTVTLDVHRPTAVVTGASSGIGRATAHRLVALGWRVIGVGRDPRRCAAAEREIAGGGDGFTMLRGDFTLMSEVIRVASEIRSLTTGLDVLINNAGGVRDRRIVTAEGAEATFAANHLAPFLLTRELLPLLRGTAAARRPRSVRVIAVASTAHRASKGMNWRDLQGLETFHAGGAYVQAKLANILFTRELARRVAAEGIVAQVMHPGVVATNFATYGDPALRAHLAASVQVAPDEPAETLVWLATDPAAGRGSGRYFHRKREEIPAEVARDDDAAGRLWVETEKLLSAMGC